MVKQKLREIGQLTSGLTAMIVCDRAEVWMEFSSARLCAKPWEYRSGKTFPGPTFIGFLHWVPSGGGGGRANIIQKKKKKSHKSPHEHRRDRSHKIKAQNTMYGFSLNLGVKESLPAGLLPSSLVTPGMVKHLPSSPSWDKRGDGAPTTSHQ